MTFSMARDIAAIIGVAVAAITLVKSGIEYTHQGAQKRADKFADMRIRFKDDQSFKNICDLLELDSSELVNIPFKDKRDFLGFFEEIAMLVNSRLIRVPVAHYMFGYYAIRCWESKNFWYEVNRESAYWFLFRDFVKKMRAIEANFSPSNDELRY